MKGPQSIRILAGQWDRVGAVALVVGGLIAITIGCVAVSDTIFTFEQIPYVMSGGLVGVCLVVLGAALWVSADLRDEWRKLDRLEDKLGIAGPAVEADRSRVEAVSPPPATADRHLRVSAEG